MTRRQALVVSAALVSGAVATRAAPASGRAGAVRKRVLFFTKSSGYEHSVVKRTGDQASHAEGILTALARQHGWELTHTKDGRVFTREGIAPFDAFVLYTTGDLTVAGTDGTPPMARDGKVLMLEAIRTGKGFVGIHSATDTFHSPGERFANAGYRADPYIRMIGGEFIQHGKQQRARLTCTDPSFPGCGDLKGGLELTEEWYSFKDYQQDLHVILVQETEGMEKSGADRVYDRPPYPATWARMHGGGRVFYTSLGHREDVWTDRRFQSLLAGGLAWVTKDVDADVTPNVKQVTPGYSVLPAPPSS